ncbi:DUF3820 family protein, partial [Escherichia coli]|nr:DUF3820 family protein [Escherichia coli]
MATYGGQFTLTKEQLIEIANTIMPFGKYKGRRLI